MANKKGGKPYGTAYDKYEKYASEERERFSARLEGLMKERNLSYEALSELLGGQIGKSTLQSYVSMKSEPSMWKIILLAKQLDCTTDYLLGLSDRPLEPEAKGMPEYLGITAEAVNSLHQAQIMAPIAARQLTGFPTCSGGTGLSILLNKFGIELVAALGNLVDAVRLTHDFIGTTAQQTPGKLSIDELQQFIADVETLQRELGAAESRLLRVAGNALDKGLDLKQNRDALDQMHYMLADLAKQRNTLLPQEWAALMQQNPLQIEFKMDPQPEATKDGENQPSE